MHYEYLFFLLLILTGVITSYTDVRKKKIKNLHLLVIVSIALLSYGIFLKSGQLKLTPALLINPLIGLSLGFILYRAGLWHAGDAKLFSTYCLLLPVQHYSPALPFSCFSLFINTFLISSVLIFILSLKEIIKNIIGNKREIIKKVISLNTARYFARILTVTFALSWMLGPVIRSLPFKSSLFIDFCILFFCYLVIYRVLNKIKSKFIFALVFFCGLTLRYIAMPGFFNAVNLIVYLLSTLGLAAIFYFINVVMRLNKQSPTRVPFAPFIFLGALMTIAPSLW